MSLLDKASLILVPGAPQKASEIWAAKPVTQSIDFTRVGDTATRVNQAGVIESVPANIPRIDYTGGGCGKLLLEPQRTNLALYSEQLDNANYAKSLATVTPNNATSPDGYQNADTLTASAGTGIPQASSFFSATAGAYTYSFFVKAGTHKNVFFASYSSDAFGPSFIFRDMIFNTDSGTITASSGNLTVSTNVQNYKNGWYKVSATYTATASGFIFFVVGLASNSTTASGTWTGSENIQVYGMQIEAGAYPTSYIPTLGASVTRGADVASKTGISSLIGATEGTFFIDTIIDFTAAQFTIAGSLVNTAVSAFNNSVYFYIVNNTIEVAVWNTPTFTGWTQQSAVQTNGRHKMAVAWKANDFAFYLDGALVGASSSFSAVPSGLDKIDLANYYASYQSDQEFNAVAVYTTRLSNAELATLTTL